MPGDFALREIEFCGQHNHDQTPVIRFIEDNWGLGRVGGQSFDALAGPVTNTLDFNEPIF